MKLEFDEQTLMKVTNYIPHSYSAEDLAAPQDAYQVRLNRLNQLSYNDLHKSLVKPEGTMHMANLLGFSIALQDMLDCVYTEYANPYYLFFLAWNYRLGKSRAISSMQFNGYTADNFNTGRAIIIRELLKMRKDMITYGRQLNSDKQYGLSEHARLRKRTAKIEGIPNNETCAVRTKIGQYYWHEPLKEPNTVIANGPNDTPKIVGPSYSMINFVHGRTGANGVQHEYTVNNRRYRFTPWGLDSTGEVIKAVTTDLTPLFSGQLVYDQYLHRWCEWPTWLNKLIVPIYFLRGPFGKGTLLLDFLRARWNKTSIGESYSIKRSDYLEFVKYSFIKVMPPVTIAQHTFVTFDGEPEIAVAAESTTQVAEVIEPDEDLMAAFADMGDLDD